MTIKDEFSSEPNVYERMRLRRKARGGCPRCKDGKPEEGYVNCRRCIDQVRGYQKRGVKK